MAPDSGNPPSKLDEVREAMKYMAERLRRKDLDAVARTHQNRDGSIDGEVRVFARHRLPTGRLLMLMQHRAPVMSFADSWATILMMRPLPEKEPDTGVIWYAGRKALRAHMHWIRGGDKSKVAKVFINAMHSDIVSVRRKKRQKVEVIIFRVHWNKDDVRPEENR